jgi:Uncharacterized conserved protein
MQTINVKRIYEPIYFSDGYRILVDRIWPRGISKESAKISSWKKDIAPSTELRRWFQHDRERFSEFVKKYEEELEENKEAFYFLCDCRDMLKLDNITFVFAAKSLDQNNAVVLQNWILKHF